MELLSQKKLNFFNPSFPHGYYFHQQSMGRSETISQQYQKGHTSTNYGQLPCVRLPYFPQKLARRLPLFCQTGKRELPNQWQTGNAALCLAELLTQTAAEQAITGPALWGFPLVPSRNSVTDASQQAQRCLAVLFCQHVPTVAAVGTRGLQDSARALLVLGKRQATAPQGASYTRSTAIQ